MSKAKALRILNEKIDQLILEGKTNTKRYRDLCERHARILRDMNIIK